MLAVCLVPSRCSLHPDGKQARAGIHVLTEKSQDINNFLDWAYFRLHVAQCISAPGALHCMLRQHLQDQI